MADAKPKAYSRKRSTKKVVKGDAQKGEGLSIKQPELEPVEPKKESKVSTPKGKDYQVVRHGAIFRVEFSTGGQIPKELSGMYTKENIAWDAIRGYEAKRGA